MTAQVLHLYIENGTDYSQDFEIVDNDGDPLDLTGAAASMQIRGAYNDGSPAVATLTTLNGDLVINGSIITANLSADVTSLFCDELAQYDLKVRPSNMLTIRAYQGYVMLDGEVTQVPAYDIYGQLDFSNKAQSVLMPGVM